MSTYGHHTKWRRNITENFNQLSRAHERYRQRDDRRQTDGFTTISEMSEGNRPEKEMFEFDPLAG